MSIYDRREGEVQLVTVRVKTRSYPLQQQADWTDPVLSRLVSLSFCNDVVNNEHNLSQSNKLWALSLKIEGVGVGGWGGGGCML